MSDMALVNITLFSHVRTVCMCQQHLDDVSGGCGTNVSHFGNIWTFYSAVCKLNTLVINTNYTASKTERDFKIYLGCIV